MSVNCSPPFYQSRSDAGGCDTGPFTKHALIRESDQAALRREGYGLGAVFGAEFVHEGADVELHGALADGQPSGDLRVLLTAGEEREHFELPGRERINLLLAPPVAK